MADEKQPPAAKPGFFSSDWPSLATGNYRYRYTCFEHSHTLRKIAYGVRIVWVDEEDNEKGWAIVYSAAYTLRDAFYLVNKCNNEQLHPDQMYELHCALLS